MKFLGRTIRLAAIGLDWEGDSKHVVAFLIKMKSEPLRGSRTPGTKRDIDLYVRVSLGPVEAKDYRGLVALLNLISQDRLDISYASKDVSKSMSSPAVVDRVPPEAYSRTLN